MRYSNTTLEAIHRAADPLAIVGRHTKPNAKGIGLCPFHDDRSPSFSVDPQTGLWHCHAGCGSGNLFQFLERAERLSFPQAVRRLAELAGVLLPSSSEDPPPVLIPEEFLDWLETVDEGCRHLEAEAAELLRKRWPKRWPKFPVTNLDALSPEELEDLEQFESTTAAFDQLDRVIEMRKAYLEAIYDTVNE